MLQYPPLNLTSITQQWFISSPGSLFYEGLQGDPAYRIPGMTDVPRPGVCPESLENQKQRDHIVHWLWKLPPRSDVISVHLLLLRTSYMATSLLKEDRKYKFPICLDEDTEICGSSFQLPRHRSLFTTEAFQVNTHYKAARKHNVVLLHLPLFSAQSCPAEGGNAPYVTGDLEDQWQ